MTQQEPFLRYLDGLSVLFEDVHPHHRFVELRIQRLDDFIVQMLLHMQKKKKNTHEELQAHIIERRGLYSNTEAPE